MTVSENTKLFKPLQVGSVSLKHRVVMAPLTRRRADAETAIPADYAAEYYGQRASGMFFFLPPCVVKVDHLGEIAH